MTIEVKNNFIAVYSYLIRDPKMTLLEAIIYSDILNKQYKFKRKWAINVDDVARYLNITSDTAKKSIDYLISIGYLIESRKFENDGKDMIEFDTLHEVNY